MLYQFKTAMLHRFNSVFIRTKQKYRFRQFYIDIDIDVFLAGISSWSLPHTVGELRSYLGLCNTLTRHIPMLADLLSPLSDLIRGYPEKKSMVKVPWTDDLKSLFLKSKDTLSSPPNLLIPDQNAEYHLYTDFSTYGKGGWIGQEYKGEILPIAFESQKLSNSEKDYSPYQGELAALVHCVKTFRWGRKVLIHTDHQSLKAILTSPNLTPFQQRWISLLTESDFLVEYYPGKLNTIADILSRFPPSNHIDTQTPTLELHASDISPTPVETFFTEVRSVTSTDPDVPRLLTSYPEELKMLNDVLWFKDRLYIPPPLRKKLFLKHHSSVYAGHFGYKPTYSHISRLYFWPHMSNDIKTWCSQCDICQRIKTSTRKPHGSLQPLPIPRYPFHHVTMDRIVHLPPSNGFTSILVICCPLTKYSHFIPCKDTDTSYDISREFVNTIFRLHGSPEVLITDRDPFFISHIWKSFTSAHFIDHRLSTAYHPQTDGQTERTNRTLEQLIRGFINYSQDNWFYLLPKLQFAFNNSPNSSTRTTPFYALYHYHPRTPGTPFSLSQAPDSLDASLDMDRLHRLLQDAKDYQSRYYNSKHSDISFSVGDFVLLSTSNLKLPYTRLLRSQKLTHKFIGPYKIIAKVGSQSYTL
jgi:hypothetical protein